TPASKSSRASHSRRASNAQTLVYAAAESAESTFGGLDLGLFLLFLGLFDDLLRDVRRDFLVAQEVHVVIAAPACHRSERLCVREDLRHRDLGLDVRH